MKQLFFIILLVFANTVAYGADCDTQDSSKNEQECKSELGCYWNDAESACQSCPAGEYCRNGISTKCIAGSYQNQTGASVCIACDAGQTTNEQGSQKANDCTACPKSNVANNGWASPTWNDPTSICKINTCKANYYLNNNNCDSCATETTYYGLSDIGSTNINQCYLTTTSGKYVKIATHNQEDCTKGNYCKGGIQIKYLSTGGSDICPQNSYCPNDGMLNHTPCPTGSKTDGTGKKLKSDCYIDSSTNFCDRNGCYKFIKSGANPIHANN